MTLHHSRPVIGGLALLFLAACTGAATAVPGSASPLGVDLGASSRIPATRVAIDASAAAHQIETSQTANSAVIPAHDGRADAHATGTVNSIDAAQRKLNITHEPIPAIGWPSMTMDFPVAPSVNLSAVKPGARVNFTIEKGKGGMYEIQAVSPAGGTR
jgi:Cu/Ag efflux protein CusF